MSGQATSDAAKEALNKANALYSQANELGSRGRWGEALPLQRQVVQLLEQAFGDGHPNTDTARMAVAGSLDSLGRYAEARTVLDQCLAARTKALGDNSPAVADILNRIGEAWRREGQTTNSLPFYERAQRILEPPAPQGPLLATVLNNRAQVALTTGDKVAAEKLLLASLAVLREIPGVNQALAAPPLTSLGELHRSLGLVRVARTEQEQALALLASVGPLHPLRLTVENNLASVLRDLRELPQAIKLYTNSIARLSEQRGPDDLSVLTMRRNYALALALDGDHPAAQTIIHDCLARLRATARTTDPLFVSLLTDQGDRQQDLSDLAAARKSFENALELSIARLGPDVTLTCGLRERLGHLAMTAGDFAHAHDLLDLALASRRRIAASDPRRAPELAACFQEWAKLERVLGRADQADGFLRQAMEIQVQHLGKGHPDVAETLEQRGLLADENGDLPAALQFHTEARRIRSGAFGETNLLVAQSRMNISSILSRQGEFAVALRESESARLVMEQLVGPDHLLAAMAVFIQANIRHRLGELDKAAPLYQRALDGFEKQRSRYASVAARDYGLLEMDRSRAEAAMTLAARALTVQQENWRNVLRFGSEQDRLAWHGMSDLLSLLAAMAPRNPVPLSTAVLHFKGAVLDSLIEDRQLNHPAADSIHSDVVTALHAARLQNYRLQLASTGRQPPTEAELRKAREDVEALETKLAQSFFALGENRRAFSATPEAVQAKLPPATVLVEYVRYRHWLGQGKTEPRFGALIFQKNAALRWIELGPAEGSDGIGALVDELQKEIRRDVPTNTATFISILQRTHERVWEKIQAAIPADTRWVMIAPDGELNFVPFAALWRRDHFLGQDLFFRYVTSARDVLTPDYQPPPQKSVDIWADPELARPLWKRATDSVAESMKSFWAAAASRGGNLPESYGPVPAARREGQMLLQIAREKNCAPVNLFLGADAREASLRRRPAPYVMHLATHGDFRLDLPPKPNLIRISASRRPDVAANPMARAWIVLAQANETLVAWRRGEQPDPADDGLLTAEEISTLNLQDTWLVTLSACDTGVGASRTGEGVFGLRRGFAFAGTRHLLMTLWPVSDDKSAEFMSAFYADALQSGDAPGALARVQRTKLELWSKLDGPAKALRWAGSYVLNSHGL